MKGHTFHNRIGLALTLAVALIAAVGLVCYAGDKKPPAPPELMDSPLPPGHDPEPSLPMALELHLTTGPYCVSVGVGDDRFGMVQTFHQADRGNLDVVRGSIANAYRLVAMQHEQKCVAAAAKAGDADMAGKVTACKGQAALLKSMADRGVVFQGEPIASTEGARPMIAPGDGGVTCVCASYYGSDVVGGAASCGGPCGNCWFCR